MPIAILVPPLSQTGDTLVLTAWLKKVGERVTKGEALFEVETDKATLEVEAPASGTLLEVLAQPGAEVPVKSCIGRIAVPEADSSAAATTPAPEPAGVNAPAARTAVSLPTERAARLLISPRARGLAEREGVPLDALTASGPRGLIVERDVRAYLAQHRAEPAAEAPAAANPTTGSRRVPLTPTRRTIARRLQASQQTTVPVTLTREVDAGELVALRERLRPDLAGLTYTDLLVSIAARCLLRHPTLNATFDGDALELYDAVNMGLAVDSERGLLVPVLRDAAGKGLAVLARERSALVERARAGNLAPEALAGGSFTLTNLGALGIDAFTPLLNPPQVAILGVGRIRPVAGGQRAMVLSLTFDHRAVDGAPAARLLVDMAGLVEKPERVWL